VIHGEQSPGQGSSASAASGRTPDDTAFAQEEGSPESRSDDPLRLPDPHGPPTDAFLPYRPGILSATLALSIVDLRVNGVDLTESAVLVDRLRIRPHGIESWADMEVTATMPDPTGALHTSAFPSGETPPLFGLLRVHCPATRLRLAVRMAPDGRGAWVARFRIRREDVERHVRIEAVVTRSRPSERANDGEANLRYALLARSQVWRVEVEEPERPGGSALDVVYVDFTSPVVEAGYRGEDASALRRVPDALVHVAIRPEGPLVLINKRHPEVIDVLLAKGTVGLRARIRDVLLRQIATTTWRTLLVEAIARLTIGDAELDEARGDDDSNDVAHLGDDHWTTRILTHAGRVFAPKEADPKAALMDALADDGRRPGILTELGERLGKVGSDPFWRLIEEGART